MILQLLTKSRKSRMCPWMPSASCTAPSWTPWRSRWRTSYRVTCLQEMVTMCPQIWTVTLDSSNTEDTLTCDDDPGLRGGVAKLCVECCRGWGRSLAASWRPGSDNHSVRSGSWSAYCWSCSRTHPLSASDKCHSYKETLHGIPFLDQGYPRVSPSQARVSSCHGDFQLTQGYPSFERGYPGIPSGVN